ncbi:MAG TPA: hypothetical protein VFK54_12645 [Candidatus Limnocylindrales bacterium]|nr:hypothetical protein [Candidatus Limnocylindrales bacterium]
MALGSLNLVLVGVALAIGYALPPRTLQPSATPVSTPPLVAASPTASPTSSVAAATATPALPPAATPAAPTATPPPPTTSPPVAVATPRPTRTAPSTDAEPTAVAPTLVPPAATATPQPSPAATPRADATPRPTPAATSAPARLQASRPRPPCPGTTDVAPGHAKVEDPARPCTGGEGSSARASERAVGSPAADGTVRDRKPHGEGGKGGDAPANGGDRPPALPPNQDHPKAKGLREEQPDR